MITGFKKIQATIYRWARWSEQYTKTDTLYVVMSNIWLNFGRIISIATGLVLTTAFANLLSPESFGTYKYIIAAAGTVGAFCLSGSNAVSRAVAQKKEHVVPGMVRVVTLWSIPASLVCAGIGVFYFLHGNIVLGWGFLFIAAFNALSNGYGLAKSILIATGEFKRSLFISIPRALFPVVVILITLLLTKNVIWIVFAYFASNFIGSWAMYRYAVWKLHIKGSSEDLAETVTFAKHMTFLGFFVAVSSQLDQLLLFHFTGAAALAVYALASAPAEEAQGMLNNFISIIFPRFAAKSKEEAHRSVALRVKQMFVIAILTTLAYIIFIPYLFRFLFPKYLPSILITQILALTLLFQPVDVIDAYLLAHGEMKKRYIWILSSQAFEFVMNCALIPLFGLKGIVASALITEAGAALAVYLVYRMR